MEKINKSKIKKIILSSLFILLTLYTTFIGVFIDVHASIILATIVVGSALVAIGCILANIHVNNHENTVFEDIYVGMCETSEWFVDTVQDAATKVVNKAIITTVEVMDILAHTTKEYIESTATLNTTTGKYEFLSKTINETVEITIDELKSNYISSGTYSDTSIFNNITGLYEYDNTNFTFTEFNNMYNYYTNVFTAPNFSQNTIPLLTINGDENNIIIRNSLDTNYNILNNNIFIGLYHTNGIPSSPTYGKQRINLGAFTDITNPILADYKEMLPQSTAGSLLSEDVFNQAIQTQYITWASINPNNAEKTIDGIIYNHIRFEIAYYDNVNQNYVIQTTEKTGDETGYGIYLFKDGIYSICNGYNGSETVVGDDLIGEFNCDETLILDTIDNLNSVDSDAAVSLTLPVTVNEDMTIVDYNSFVSVDDVLDDATTSILEDAGVDVEASVIEAEFTEGSSSQLQMPTLPGLKIKGIWYYVEYMMNMAQQYLLFLYNVFNSIPKIARWSFLGGFVLMFLMGLVSRLLK